MTTTPTTTTRAFGNAEEIAHHDIRIDLTGPETATIGDNVITHGTPIFAMARRLLAGGADPNAIVQTYTWTGTPSLRGPLGALARLAVVERPSGPRGFTRYHPHPNASGTSTPTPECPNF